MFKNIVESILNEISAEDAYSKFYTNLSRDVFNGIVNAYGGKFDNLIKVVLKSVMEKSCGLKDAYSFLDEYKNAPNEVRIAFLNNFKSGEYEDVLDMMQGLSELMKNGVNTAKKRREGGYVELYNDNDYLLTCTLTYEASQHYYGKSKWCTASDRFGKYDGWYFFLSYVFDISDIRGNYKELGTRYPVSCVLVQFTDKSQNNTYQIQYGGNDYYGQICDFEDRSVDEEDFLSHIFPSYLSDLLDDKFEELLSMEKECFKTEYEYQTDRNNYVEAKRAKIQERRTLLQRQLKIRNEMLTKKKGEFVMGKFNELKSNSKLLSMPSFLKQVISNSYEIKKIFNGTRYGTPEEIAKCEEIAKKQFYCMVYKIVRMFEDVYEVTLFPIFGSVKDITFDHNDNPVLKDVFYTGTSFYNSNLNGAIVAFVRLTPPENGIDYENDYSMGEEPDVFTNTEVEQVAKVIQLNDEYKFSIKKMIKMVESISLYDKGPEFCEDLDKYVLMQEDCGSHQKCILLDCSTNMSAEFEAYKMINYCLAYDDSLFLFYFNRVGSLDFFEVSRNPFKHVATYIGDYVAGGEEYYIIDESHEIYILGADIYKTGLKADSWEHIDARKYGSCVAIRYNDSLEQTIYDLRSKKVLCTKAKIIHNDNRYGRDYFYLDEKGAQHEFPDD